MTEAYRTQQLANAKQELASATVRMNSIKVWGKKKREASEDVEFWGSKVAFLENVKI